MAGREALQRRAVARPRTEQRRPLAMPITASDPVEFEVPEDDLQPLTSAA